MVLWGLTVLGIVLLLGEIVLSHSPDPSERYEPARGPVLAYLLLPTRSMAINRLQQRRNRWQLLQRWSEQLFPSAVPGPQDHAEAENLAERVRTALASIPASQREVLKMA